MRPSEFLHFTNPTERDVDTHENREEPPYVEIFFDNIRQTARFFYVRVVNTDEDRANLTADEVDIVDAEAQLCTNDQNLREFFSLVAVSRMSDFTKLTTMLIGSLDKQRGAVDCQAKRAKHDDGHGNNSSLPDLVGQEKYTEADECFEDRGGGSKRAELLNFFRLSHLNAGHTTLLVLVM